MAADDCFDRISWGEFEQMMARFKSYVLANNKQYDTVLGISRGGLVPAVLVSHRLDVADLKTIRIRRNKTNEPNSQKGIPVFEAFPFTELQGKTILVVDDVSSTGGTLKSLYQQFNLHGITDFETFVVVKFDMAEQPPEQLNICFYGKEGTDWAVFPWEKPV